MRNSFASWGRASPRWTRLEAKDLSIKYFLNILAGFDNRREALMRPAAAQILRERLAGPLDGFPPTRCLPGAFR
jgi:hypothetical protein